MEVWHGRAARARGHTNMWVIVRPLDVRGLSGVARELSG